MDAPEQHEQPLADAEDETVFMKAASPVQINALHTGAAPDHDQAATPSTAVQPVVRCHAYTVQMMPWLN